MAVVSAFETITIQEDGKDKSLYVVGPSWYAGMEGEKIKIEHGGRSYLAESDALGPNNFYMPNWRGGSITFDVDVSEANCGCNAALYFVSMPAKDQNGTPLPSDGKDYYCDANKGAGSWCPEFDVMEANQYAFHATPHKCDAPNDKGHYYNCDRGGQCFQVAQSQGTYGPNKQINTLKPYTVKTTFDKYDHFVTELTQNGFTLTMTSECGSYYPQIVGDLEAGMAIAISAWGQPGLDMTWLDADTGCSENCNTGASTYISNIKVVTGGTGPPPPPPVDNYDYGDACATTHDDDCSLFPSCYSCNWSWPSNDPAKWASKDAKCRCKSHSAEEDVTLIQQ